MNRKLCLNLALGILLFYITIGPLSNPNPRSHDRQISGIQGSAYWSLPIKYLDSFHESIYHSKNQLSEHGLLPVSEDQIVYIYNDTLFIFPRLLHSSDREINQKRSKTRQKLTLTRIADLVNNALANIITLIIVTISAYLWKWISNKKNQGEINKV